MHAKVIYENNTHIYVYIHACTAKYQNKSKQNLTYIFISFGRELHEFSGFGELSLMHI